MELQKLAAMERKLLLLEGKVGDRGRISAGTTVGAGVGAEAEIRMGPDPSAADWVIRGQEPCPPDWQPPKSPSTLRLLGKLMSSILQLLWEIMRSLLMSIKRSVLRSR